MATAHIITYVMGLPQRGVYRSSRKLSKRWNKTALKDFQYRKHKIKKLHNEYKDKKRILTKEEESVM
jgi:hypothetical protein